MRVYCMRMETTGLLVHCHSLSHGVTNNENSQTAPGDSNPSSESIASWEGHGVVCG